MVFLLDWNRTLWDIFHNRCDHKQNCLKVAHWRVMCFLGLRNFLVQRIDKANFQIFRENQLKLLNMNLCIVFSAWSTESKFTYGNIQEPLWQFMENKWSNGLFENIFMWKLKISKRKKSTRWCWCLTGVTGCIPGEAVRTAWNFKNFGKELKFV